jgi:hypothetical protein
MNCLDGQFQEYGGFHLHNGFHLKTGPMALNKADFIAENLVLPMFFWDHKITTTVIETTLQEGFS